MLDPRLDDDPPVIIPLSPARPLPLRLSPSAINDFRQCRLRYAYLHLDRTRAADRRPISRLMFGEVVHQVLAEFTNRGGRAALSREETLELLLERWRGEVYPDPETEAANFDRAARMIDEFYARPYPPRVAHDLGVERRLTWRRFRRGVQVTGQIDRAVRHDDGAIEVIDYKTGDRVLSRSEVAAEPQALIYRTLAAEAFAALAPPTIDVTFHFLDRGSPVRVRYERDDFLARWATIDRIANEIRVAISAVIAGEPVKAAFPPSPGDRCRSCSVRSACAAAALDPAGEGLPERGRT